MDRIRILYVIDYLAVGGGTELQLRELLGHLDRDRFEPRLITLNELFKTDDLNDLCPHTCLYIDKLRSLSTMRKIRSVAKLIRQEKIDIVQTFFIDANFVGVLAGYFGGCRNIVVSRRDMGYWYNPRLLFWLNRVNRRADFCLTNSKAIKQVVIERECFHPDQVKVIYNGLRKFPLDEPSRMTKTDIGIPDSAPVVGMVGNHRRVKRIDQFIRVAERIADKRTHFVMVGGYASEAESNLKNELIQQIQKAGLTDRFHMTHVIKNVHDYIKLFDVALLTSDSEGLSNSLIEYLLCGTPAIAFDVGGNREVIDEGITGFLIPAGDVNTMCRRTEQLLKDGQLREKMGREGIARARKRFDGQRMVKETSDFYTWLAGKR